ncbi:MAG: YraN family protein [Thermoleophilia bacterium]
MASTRGAAAEAAVARRLARRGWRIAARNWRGGGEELDLVAERDGVLAFVEVKARSDPAALAEPVRAAQAARLHRAAEAYLARHPHAGEVRMDLAAVRRIGPWHRVRVLPGGAAR